MISWGAFVSVQILIQEDHLYLTFQGKCPFKIYVTKYIHQKIKERLFTYSVHYQEDEGLLLLFARHFAMTSSHLQSLRSPS